MFVTINGADLNVEVLGPAGAPVLIAHHGGGGIGSLDEPKATFGPLADELRVVVFDARGCEPGLPGVRCPTLVTVGRSDWITPVSSAQTITSLIPDSRLVIFEKSGHSPQIEESDLFQKVIRDFLHEVLGPNPCSGQPAGA